MRRSVEQMLQSWPSIAERAGVALLRGCPNLWGPTSADLEGFCVGDARIRCNLFSKAWRNDPATAGYLQGWRSRHGGGRVHDRGVFALGGEIDNGALAAGNRRGRRDVTHPPRRVRVGVVRCGKRRSPSAATAPAIPAHTTHTAGPPSRPRRRQRRSPCATVALTKRQARGHPATIWCLPTPQTAAQRY